MKNRYLGLEIMKSMGPDHCIPGSTVHCFSPRSSCFIHGHCAHFERAWLFLLTCATLCRAGARQRADATPWQSAATSLGCS